MNALYIVAPENLSGKVAGQAVDVVCIAEPQKAPLAREFESLYWIDEYYTDRYNFGRGANELVSKTGQCLLGGFGFEKSPMVWSGGSGRIVRHRKRSSSDFR